MSNTTTNALLLIIAVLLLPISACTGCVFINWVRAPSAAQYEAELEQMREEHFRQSRETDAELDRLFPGP